MILIHLIAAARPNFMKIAPLYHALKQEKWVKPVIVHTGQHYDLNMSDIFFRDLKLPVPDIHLGVGSGSHAEQTGQVMMAYEKVLDKDRPDLVIVVGDVNSTMAATIASTKVIYSNPTNSTSSANPTKLPHRPLVAHLEAGLRSFDRTMPEEINRLVTDTLSDILWTPSPDGDYNLIDEGIQKEKIIRVGNIMIDSLEMMRSKIEEQNFYKKFELNHREYAVATLHRPSNVDDIRNLNTLCQLLVAIAGKVPIIFPLHPRTRKNLEKTGLITFLEQTDGLYLIEPVSYVLFMNLVFHCRLAITDSGGIQEETTYLGIPCLTLRPNTERPITITEGTNRLCHLKDLVPSVEEILFTNTNRQPCTIDMWDGHTADRVVKSIKSIFLEH